MDGYLYATKLNAVYGRAHAMLTEAYIEALLVDEELADQVWSIWDQGEIDDCLAWIAWLLIIKDFS